jgi:hypothetical protein
MKMNRFNLGMSLIALTATLITGCKEPVQPVAPEPDAELQSVLDATWATYVITDIDQMCAFMGENELFNMFYIHVPGTPPLNQVTVERNTEDKNLRMLFNDSPCLDGRMRQGTVFMRYGFDPIRKPGANPNSEYYDEYGFSGQLSLLNYRVDGWLVENFDTKYPAYVYCELEAPKFDPKVTKLRWQIAGKFRFTHPNDTLKKRSIVWEGKVFKTLENTNEPLVFTAARQVPINWALAVCSYSGNVEGTTNATVPFKMELGAFNQPLVRDFKCFPDKIAGVAVTTNSNVLAQRFEEHHPFIKGVATFTTGDKYPRHVYYGNEGNPDLSQQCDNVGEVLIKGISYKVNFKK